MKLRKKILLNETLSKIISNFILYVSLHHALNQCRIIFLNGSSEIVCDSNTSTKRLNIHLNTEKFHEIIIIIVILYADMCSLKQKIAAATEAPPPLSPWQPNSRSPLYNTQDSSEQKRMRSILISHSLKQNSMKLASHGVSQNFYEYSRIWVKELTSIHRGIILSLSFKYIQMPHKHTLTLTCRINRKRKYTI